MTPEEAAAFVEEHRWNIARISTLNWEMHHALQLSERIYALEQRFEAMDLAAAKARKRRKKRKRK